MTDPTLTPPFPNWDAGFYALLSTALWVILIVGLVYVFRKEISRLLAGIVRRLEEGALIKIGNIELAPIRVSVNKLPDNALIEAYIDNSLERERDSIYKSNHGLFVVHRLFPSAIEGQLYDILVYLVAHEGHIKGQLDKVDRVDYYFGSAWGHNVFTSKDRGKRFAIVVSAFGSGFLCFARVHLHDGTSFTTTRYIDFESGALGSSS